MFFDVAVVLEIPEVAHDVRRVVKDFGNAFGCLVGERCFDWNFSGNLKEEVIAYFGWKVINGSDCFSLEGFNFFPLARGHIYPGGY